MDKVFKIKIVTEVEASVTLGPNETLEDLRNRNVDIFLHGPQPEGWQDREDLGNDRVQIMIKEAGDY